MGAVAGELAVLVTGAAQPCRVGIDATIVHQSFELMNINQVAIKKVGMHLCTKQLTSS